MSSQNKVRTDLSLPPRLLALVFAPFAAGFFLSYVFRNVNAVIGKDLAAEFSLSPAEVGLLTSMYLFSFAAMQVPVGVFLDRYGPRRVVAGLLCISALGALGFGLAGSFGELALGRALIGLGVSACLMGSIKAFTLWFPLARLATLNGWMIAIGGVGGLAATSPLEALLGPFGWRAVFVGMAAGCALSAAAIFFAAAVASVSAQPTTHPGWPVTVSTPGLARSAVIVMGWPVRGTRGRISIPSTRTSRGESRSGRLAAAASSTGR